MARYRSRAGRRARRNRMYAFLFVLIAGVAVVLYFNFFGENKTDIDVVDANFSEPAGTDISANSLSYVPAAPQNPGVAGAVPLQQTTQQEPILPAPAEQTTVQEIVVPQTSVSEQTRAQEPNDAPDLLTEQASGPSVPANPEADSLIAEALAFLDERPPKVIQARDTLNSVLRIPMSFEQRKQVKEKLSDLADQWLFSPTVYEDDPLCDTYVVQSGDRLASIAKRCNVPYELLMKVNHISDPVSLRAGQKIKLVKGPFHLKVYRSTFVMDVYQQTTYVRSFLVGLGLPGHETPTGIWQVERDNKLIQPPWPNPDTGEYVYAEDPDYPLGSRWIGIEGISGDALGRDGFGIHGTKDPDQIGKQGSQGCIRMYNGEVIFVFDLLEPELSQVEVAD